MGITHVHLLPVQDYPFGDETEKADEYSWYDWGYGTMLFNTPEGSYASKSEGIVRQREFKEMVQALHRKNIGVVLDVVYNHTAATGTSPESVFDKVLPFYFYRRDAAGNYTSASGCGNDIASQRPMARKFIVDSVKYWMNEYHVDGFRFDLMGLIDRETMLEVYREAKRINPDAILYGEGWDMERLLPAEQMMTQKYVRGTGIAAFNDGIRDTVKGEVWDGATPGFAQGAGLRLGMQQFRLNIKGQSTDGGIEVDSPNETVNYVSSHDDHCLWDKICLSTPGVPESLRINMDKLSFGIVVTSQGIPFLHAGDEFLRSKNAVKNSYNSNDPNVNPIDWRRKSKYKEVVEYYRGLIRLRKSHPAFRMTDRATVDDCLTFLQPVPKQVVAFTLGEHANGDDWKIIMVIYNGNREAKEIRVSGTWHVVANAHQAGVDSLATVSDKLRVDACSLVVAYSEAEEAGLAR
jgi:pullulanase